MASIEKRILILCKTYPTPSAKHAETSCVAGMTEDGEMIRLYPVPFRLIDDSHQFKKWQWIRARVEKSRADHRQESHRIFVDTVACEGDPVSPKQEWKLRRSLIASLPVHTDFAEVEKAREGHGETLALLRPARVLGLDITPTERPEWTEEEKAKLLALQLQGDLFASTQEASSIATLKKLPFDFHYRYECATSAGPISYRHKIVDWEAGALFWNVRKAHGNGWEQPFRQKLEAEFARKDLHFLLGTIHRFPDKWLIVSLIYPPKPQPTEAESQGSLFDQ